MTIIEPSRRKIEPSHTLKRYSAPLRLWHWANLIVICGSLTTVLINSTITDDHQTSAIIRDQLQKSGLSVTADQARSAAHALSDSVWDVHAYFGYCLAGLLLFRLLMEFFQIADQKFIRILNKAWQHFKTVKKDREARHEFAVKSIYALFYLLLIAQVLTGLFLAFEDAMAPFKSIRHTVKDVHGFIMYLILAFIVVHLAGVFLAERKDAKGIVSDMINGGSE
jgi:Ni/Fe-hydrogenase 1 B-type cytochrome subunit